MGATQQTTPHTHCGQPQTTGCMRSSSTAVSAESSPLSTIRSLHLYPRGLLDCDSSIAAASEANILAAACCLLLLLLLLLSRLLFLTGSPY
jgi:hypothetical protein